MVRALNEVMIMKGFTHKAGNRKVFGFPCSGKELACLSRLIKPDTPHEVATIAINTLHHAPAAYVGRIPEGLDSVAAGPVICAGVTTYKGIKVADCKPGEWIVVSGIGGLGHLAV
jgi:NADPH:quinone reductase-like Zn-dependent oxidoreductase